jgi:hypothetical protein
MTAGRVAAEELGRSQRVAFSVVLHSRRRAARIGGVIRSQLIARFKWVWPQRGAGVFAPIRILAPHLKPKLTIEIFRSSATHCAIVRAAID